MASLDGVFGEQRTFSPDDYEKIPDEQKLEIVKAIHTRIVEMLISSNSPQLKAIGKLEQRMLKDASDTPPGLIRMVGVDSLEVFEHIMDGMDIPQYMRRDFFPMEIDQLSSKPNPEVYYVFATAPIDNALYNKGKLTEFLHLSAVIINTKIIQLIDNPRLLIFKLLSEMSFIADCYKLHEGIAKGEVYVGALGPIYMKMLERSNAAAKTFIKEINEQTGTISFSGLTLDLQRILRLSAEIDELSGVEKLFKEIPKTPRF